MYNNNQFNGIFTIYPRVSITLLKKKVDRLMRITVISILKTKYDTFTTVEYILLMIRKLLMMFLSKVYFEFRFLP